MKLRHLSKTTYEKLCEVIPGGVNSPVRACHEMEQLPMVVESGAKDELFDVDGHSYIDFCGSWGALLHGHAHPSIIDAAYQQMKKGTTFGITSAVEEKLGRKIVELIDSVEKIRFVSSGTEATMSAIRLARGYTKRDFIVKFNGNYHGHADFFLVQAGSGLVGLSPTSSSAGIPADLVKHTICLPYNDIEACLKVFKDPKMAEHIAAVILEPIAGNIGVVPATKEFIQMLRDETKKIGALLIFDEVITGFRVSLGGAQALYKITPDLSCYAKIIGGGFPAAAFGGRKEIMDYLAPLGPVYQAGTLSGNPVAMCAGFEAITLAQKTGFYEELEKKTALLVNPIQDAIKSQGINACVQRVGSMFTLFFGRSKVSNLEEAKQLNTKLYAELFRFLFEHGVYIPPSQHEAWFISSVHTEEHIKKARDLIVQFIKQIK
jgi:glutamate-1-semialdehyde 2,1-aminomutase